MFLAENSRERLRVDDALTLCLPLPVSNISSIFATTHFTVIVVLEREKKK
jgi:hypothetical protein